MPRKPNDILVAHDDRCATINDGTHGQLRLERHADLAHQDQIEQRIERGGDFGRNGHATARKRENNWLLILIRASAVANLRPASERSLNGIAASWLIVRAHARPTWRTRIEDGARNHCRHGRSPPQALRARETDGSRPERSPAPWVP